LTVVVKSSPNPGDLTDSEWALLEPRLLIAKPGGRPCTTSLRIKGHMRQVITSMLGCMLFVIVHKAAIQDRDGTVDFLKSIRSRYA